MKTKTETEKVLIRLKTWLGKERARYERLRQDPYAGTASKERAYGEATVCSLAMSRIDKELRKLRGSR